MFYSTLCSSVPVLGFSHPNSDAVLRVWCEECMPAMVLVDEGWGVEAGEGRGGNGEDGGGEEGEREAINGFSDLPCSIYSGAFLRNNPNDSNKPDSPNIHNPYTPNHPVISIPRIIQSIQKPWSPITTSDTTYKHMRQLTHTTNNNNTDTNLSLPLQGYARSTCNPKLIMGT